MPSRMQDKTLDWLGLRVIPVLDMKGPHVRAPVQLDDVRNLWIWGAVH